MDAAQIANALQDNALWVVFVNVLLQQLGLPIPAVPTLMIAGSLAATPGAAPALLSVAVVASVIADVVWYVVGRLLGYRVLAGLCRLSINPGSCVSRTEERFLRWGIWSLVVAKFVPGFSTVAPPIAGTLRMGLLGFISAAAAGAAAWAGSALIAGWLLRDQVLGVLAVLSANGPLALAVVAAMLAGWFGWKWWQKSRFERLAAMPHATPDEYHAAVAAGFPVLLLDLRGASMVLEEGAIPGARAANHDNLPDAVADWPKTAPIMALCACPEDAGAVQAARELQKQGYVSVRPIRGGWEAWKAHGFARDAGALGAEDVPVAGQPESG